MKLTQILTAAFIASVSLSASAASSVAPSSSSSTDVVDTAAKERTRIEELFIWKASEELKLGASEEAKFTELIRSFNTQRRSANVKMDEALAELSKAKSKAEAEKALAKHRSALRAIQSVQTAEIDQLRPLLGPQKLAQYLVVKSSILEKLKQMLATPNVVPQAPQTAGAAESTPISK